MSPRITLIHAVMVAIPPVLEAFREGWPAPHHLTSAVSVHARPERRDPPT